MLNHIQIANILKEKKYKLLGQIEISEEEYHYLIEYLKKVIKSLPTASIPSPDLMISVALVQIAIRKYQDGKFWPCFIEELGFNVPQSRLNYIGKIFFKTIERFGLFMPRADDGDFQYVEYIKTHAFVTNYYMQGFFDFSYAYYENNLFRQLNSEFIEEDFEDLSSFMCTTLANKNDSIVESKNNTASKSYKLLKSTRTAFALCSPEIIRKLFFPVLKLIDNYFYDNEIPKISQNRYEEAFIEWCKIQIQKSNQTYEKHNKIRKAFSHKPYIYVSIDEEISLLVIPPQKFRDEDCNGEANAIIEINGHEEIIPLEVYKSFGLYITEEKRIPIPSIFDSIKITIKTLSEKNFLIPSANYRIFDTQWKCRPRFETGHNYILVRYGISTRWENSHDELDSYDGYKNWNYFSANINENSVFYVGNKPISIIGEFSPEPFFEKKIEHFKIFEKSGNEIISSREHPTISFVVEKEKISGSVLIVNNIKYPINNINEKICFDWPENKQKIAVNIPLNTFLPTEDKKYDIILDVPGEGNKKICNYLLLKKFDCRFNKPRYTFCKNATLKITKDEHFFHITNESWELESETEKSISYIIPLETSPENAEFILYLYDEYKITMPIKIFKYGFSENSMTSQKSEYLWYADLKETLYVKIPGAKSVSAYCKNEEYKFHGALISPDTFRIDISEFVRHIKDDTKNKYHYITLEYEDNAKRKLVLPVIYRQMVINPYFKLFLEDDIPSIDVEIKGDSKVFLEVQNEDGEIIIQKKPIISGKNIFPELSKDKYYTFNPFTEEDKEFSFISTKEYMASLKNVFCIDLNNLEKCELILKALSAEENILPLSYEYHLNLHEKKTETSYIGSLIGYKTEKQSARGTVYYEKDDNGNRIRKKMGKVRVFISRIEKELNVSLQIYSYEDEQWYSMYYDKKTKALIHVDDPILNTKERNRFIELDEESSSTLFNVDVNKIRKHKEW